jgi:indolepyruvate ferredoxin oxidoreductase beta subunit
MNILLAGVGGQGIILAGEIISEVAMASGYDVKKSEVHGMAQRGGAVSSHVRFGEKIYSPLIETGTADIILAFEKLESLRHIQYLKKDGIVIVNDQQIEPLPVSAGLDKHPDNIWDMLREKAKFVYIVDGLGIAKKLNNPRTINIAMIGALSKHLDIEESVWKDVIKNLVPKGTEELNLSAFDMGREECQSSGNKRLSETFSARCQKKNDKKL